MLRSTFLYLSSAGWSRKFVTSLGLARRAARRFVAGETLQEAVDAARELNKKGLLVSLDQLGESVHNEQQANHATDEYIGLLEAIKANDLRSSSSVKLTQLGLDISDDLCLNNMRRLLTKAKELGVAVTIDMESTAYTDRTIQIFRTLRPEFDNVGTVIQAYLYRSEADMDQLATEGARVRLCKGAYKEPADKAFPQKADVDDNYIKIVHQYMTPENIQHGAYLEVASHDPKMIEATQRHVTKHNIASDKFEFQMLYGIRSATQLELAQQGFQVRVYVPYGTEWYPYFMRRLAERPANVWFMAKNLFSK
ncbi:MAG: proline dehydrogenase family protein [Chloroflexi bacterium]|nr:proline dehydrogenase family protein [Chloroflexota bacterium]